MHDDVNWREALSSTRAISYQMATILKITQMSTGSVVKSLNIFLVGNYLLISYIVIQLSKILNNPLINQFCRERKKKLIKRFGVDHSFFLIVPLTRGWNCVFQYSFRWAVSCENWRRNCATKIAVYSVYVPVKWYPHNVLSGTEHVLSWHFISGNHSGASCCYPISTVQLTHGSAVTSVDKQCGK